MIFRRRELPLLTALSENRRCAVALAKAQDAMFANGPIPLAAARGADDFAVMSVTDSCGYTAKSSVPPSWAWHPAGVGPRYHYTVEIRVAGPRAFRWIGCCYNPSKSDLYFYDARLPEEYDLIIYFENTRAAWGLPFRYPDSW